MSYVDDSKEREFDDHELEIALKVLSSISGNKIESRNPRYLALQIEAGKFISPLTKSEKKERKKMTRKIRKKKDLDLLEETEIKKNRVTGKKRPPHHREDSSTEEQSPPVKKQKIEPCEEKEFLAHELEIPNTCYICFQKYNKVHHFYHRLCPECSVFNYSKRNRTVDLRGKVALVTGGRIRIGFFVALELLRSGATVHVTTRFPKDAASRYSRERDFDDWKDRLHIWGLDMRDLRWVEEFTNYFIQNFPRLDILINNAAQTVRRPVAFYDHLKGFEEVPYEDLGPFTRKLLHHHFEFESHFIHQKRLLSGTRTNLLERGSSKDLIPITQVPSYDGLSLSARMAQTPVTEEDHICQGPKYFPPGVLDEIGQQVDLRTSNSWVSLLPDIPLVEAVEVMAINSLAPMLLCSKLKPILQNKEREKSSPPFSWIINVTSVEGSFDRERKTVYHPHTNMAKAALNMLTRTSSVEYSDYNIFMTSVDTGWVSEQSPTKTVQENDRFDPPLDEIDAALRILDPIYNSITTGEKKFGVLFKNYKEVTW